MANCPFCGEQILDNAKKCKHCHEFLDPVLIRSMSGSRHNSATSSSPQATLPASGICNSLNQLGQTRAILMIRGMSAESIELAFRETEYGSFGAHKFYLGQPIGWIYLIFFWTYIPAIVGFIEAILFFLTTDEAFDRTFN